MSDAAQIRQTVLPADGRNRSRFLASVMLLTGRRMLQTNNLQLFISVIAIAVGHDNPSMRKNKKLLRSICSHLERSTIG